MPEVGDAVIIDGRIAVIMSINYGYAVLRRLTGETLTMQLPNAGLQKIVERGQWCA